MTMQLASKMRFVSAQLTALLEDDLWRANAAHANAMAARLRAALAPVTAGEVPDGGTRAAPSGLAFTQPTQANAVFAVLPRAVADRLRADVAFYDWAAAAPTPSRATNASRCAGCARGTRRRRTSTRSPRQSARRSGHERRAGVTG